MTPPSLTVAREILTLLAAKLRTGGDPVNEGSAASIDVVLAALDQSVHGDASAIKVSTTTAAIAAPTAILLGSIPGVRSIKSREDAREVFGRQDGDAVWDAFGRAPPVLVAPIPGALDFKSEPAHKLGPEAIAVSNEQKAGERYLAAALRSLLEDLGLTPSGTGSEDPGILELEIKRLRAGERSR